MSFWDKLFKGKAAETITDPYGTLNPEQKAMVQGLGPYFNNLISGGTPTYSGNYTAPLTSSEQGAIDRNARLSALGEQGLSPLLRGEFPEDYYQQSIYKPMMKQYTKDVAPLIEEQYTGTGGYWGSARAGAVGKGYRDLTDTLAAKRAELGWEAQKNIPTAVNAANALAAQEAQMQAIPRLIQQYGLDQQYKEWTRAQDANRASIDQALNFLNISTVTREDKPGLASMFQQIAATGLLGVGGGVASDAMSDYPEYQATASSSQATMDAITKLLSQTKTGGQT